MTLSYRCYIRALPLVTLLLLASCSSTTKPETNAGRYSQAQDAAPTAPPKDIYDVPNAVPKVEPLSRGGNKPVYTVNGQTYRVLKSSQGYDEKGIASWYGTKFNGYHTSNGEIYDMYKMTAANKVLPIPTYVQVTNLKNGKQVIVRVNDRGPFHQNRIIDLSYAAAAKLDMLSTGTALVEVKAINPSTYNAKSAQTVTQVKPENPQIYLQVAAFGQKANAEALVARIKHQVAEPVFIRNAMVNGNVLYRVQIGPISDVDETDAIYDKLRAEKLGKPFTVLE